MSDLEPLHGRLWAVGRDGTLMGRLRVQGHDYAISAKPCGGAWEWDLELRLCASGAWLPEGLAPSKAGP